MTTVVHEIISYTTCIDSPLVALLSIDSLNPEVRTDNQSCFHSLDIHLLTRRSVMMEMCLKLSTSVEYWDAPFIVVFSVVFRLWLRERQSPWDQTTAAPVFLPLLLSVSLSRERKVQSVSLITGWLTTHRQHWSAAGVLPPFYRRLFSKMSCGICQRNKNNCSEAAQVCFVTFCLWQNVKTAMRHSGNLPLSATAQ